jgi:CheY-like chemotaxis protein
LTIVAHPIDQDGSASGVSPAEDQESVDDNKLPQLNCHILLVEDGRDNQRLISLLLQKAGAKVTVVDNGQKALAWINSHDRSVDDLQLILMDMQMPIVDGYEATRLLRAAGYNGPILALTAHAMKEDRQKCLDAGCDNYLSKPIDRLTLLRLVSLYTHNVAPLATQTAG